MKLFQISRRLMNTLQRAADIAIEELPDGDDRQRALAAIADAGAHALRAAASRALLGNAPTVSATATQSEDNGRSHPFEVVTGAEVEAARAELFAESDA